MGEDSIKSGITSLIVGFILVILFMFYKYKLFGLVANTALIANLLMLIGVLTILEATLTLPGIAGIILTVGMAVDANVLIFERIKEELKTENQLFMHLTLVIKSKNNSFGCKYNNFNSCYFFFLAQTVRFCYYLRHRYHNYSIYSIFSSQTPNIYDCFKIIIKKLKFND